MARKAPTKAAKVNKAKPKKGKAKLIKKTPAKKVKSVAKKEEVIRSTPHIGAPIGGGKFSEVCICPGDPLRAKWISDRFL